MMKKIFVFIIALIVLASCQKDRDLIKVDYMITGFGDPYMVSYLDVDGATVTEKISPDGISDVWRLSFMAEPGTPLYLYVKSQEDISNSMGFSLGLLINGKYYQQAKNYDGEIVIQGQKYYEIKRSGVVPF
ncbi:MAG: hypothetical protein DSY76_05605 [Bacteroidetes bacterium]|nr:MAG: hypothetical protein DSY76_05605 [Bacteroidota bacterium]